MRSRPLIGVTTSEVYPLWIPDREHVVSPWFPAWLEFVF